VLTDAGWNRVLIGKVVAGYRIESRLGSGGFATVYEATDIVQGKRIALKILNPGGTNLDVRSEFDREGQLLSKLSGASAVVALFDSSQDSVEFEVDGFPLQLEVSFHALDLAKGCLADFLGDLPSLSWRKRLELWRDCILGVHQMHLRGIVHRDLKAENCLIFSDPKRSIQARVSDLGRARDLTQAALHPGQYARGRGDNRFAPPEFVFVQGSETAEAHRCADLYGLGSLLFELATGVGLTSLALNLDRGKWEASWQAHANNQFVDLSSLNGHYARAFMALDDSLPRAIARPAGDLVRQLCRPDPPDRLPRTGLGSRGHRSQGLEWLLARADILMNILIVSERNQRQH